MSILNRRNAITGWAVWKLVQRLVKRKARNLLPSSSPPARKPPVKGVVALLTTAALGVAGFLRLRRRSRD
jgi:hypothetical protein